jgi:CheY-like chemotaxis protein
MVKKRIMIVEDESITAMRIKKSLEDIGYSVTSTEFTGEEAVMKAAEDQPDLVLMDIVLDGRMDGIEAAQKIRNSKDNVFNNKIPIIAITAHDIEGEKERCLAAGMNSCVTKPFDLEELFEEIEKLALVGKITPKAEE